METISTPHPLRTMILRYDRERTAPAFETLALQSYQEIHDRTFEIKQRVQHARKQVSMFNFQIEELGELFIEAKRKLDHLKVMYPTNPDKETVREQLSTYLKEMSALMDDFVSPMMAEVRLFFRYDDYIFEHEQWMDEVAYPQFSEVIARYEECSVDIVYFDRDLEDFRHALSVMKKLEGKYIDEMNQLVDNYSDLNYEIEGLFEDVEIFDETLLE